LAIAGNAANVFAQAAHAVLMRFTSTSLKIRLRR
jgi:hypothetical protein